MTRTLISFLLLISLVGLLLANAVIVEFSAEPSIDKTILYWKTGEEKDVEIFLVERSLDNQSYMKIGEVEPKGNNSEYQFIDENLSETQNIFYYRLKIKNTDGSSQITEPVTVIPNISSIKRTWGSIKALFR